MHQYFRDVARHLFLIGEAVTDRIDHSCNSAKAVKSAAWQISDVSKATKRSQMMRADAVNRDAADDDYGGAIVFKAIVPHVPARHRRRT